jgi:hypothetical protein
MLSRGPTDLDPGSYCARLVACAIILGANRLAEHSTDRTLLLTHSVEGMGFELRESSFDGCLGPAAHSQWKGRRLLPVDARGSNCHLLSTVARVGKTYRLLAPAIPKLYRHIHNHNRRTATSISFKRLTCH